jgi:hypothetical protein
VLYQSVIRRSLRYLHLVGPPVSADVQDPAYNGGCPASASLDGEVMIGGRHDTSAPPCVVRDDRIEVVDRSVDLLLRLCM